jgi:hypothetical protein
VESAECVCGGGSFNAVEAEDSNRHCEAAVGDVGGRRYDTVSVFLAVRRETS